MILIKIGITSQDRPITVDAKKKKKYDVLANKLRPEMKCRTKTIPYVIAWDGVVSKHHKRTLG
ncbi:hypothetical protein PAEPH01_0460 [Pancytospora epiphaga]|nr:hypothetical protein PAEPH01_0460 [Pancytospora epiphaga]